MRSFFLLFFLIMPSFCYAGAWTQAKGKTLAQITARYYNTDSYYDNLGVRNTMAPYTKYELNPYVEYGWREGITFGANIFLERASQSGNENWGLADSEFFTGLRLWQGNGYSFSIEPMVKLPGLADSGNLPRIGGSHPDAGLTLASGYSSTFWGYHYYVNVDTGFRHRFGTPHDQVKIDTTLGIEVTPRLTLLPQIFTTTRVRVPAAAIFTQSSRDDYNLVKLQFSALYSFDDSLYVQAGVFSHIAGHNVGNGDGVLLAVGKKF